MPVIDDVDFHSFEGSFMVLRGSNYFLEHTQTKHFTAFFLANTQPLQEIPLLNTPHTACACSTPRSRVVITTRYAASRNPACALIRYMTNTLQQQLKLTSMYRFPIVGLANIQYTFLHSRASFYILSHSGARIGRLL